MRDEASLAGLRLKSDIAAIKPFGDAGVGDAGAGTAVAAARGDDDDADGRGRACVPARPPPPAGVAADVAGLRDSLQWFLLLSGHSVVRSLANLRTGCFGHM